MSYLSWHVGMKVVCVNDETTPGQPLEPLPSVGEVVTVERIYVAFDGTVMVELAEYPSPETDEWLSGFEASCYRPLVTRKTSIAIFTAMLHGTDHTVDA